VAQSVQEFGQDKLSGQAIIDQLLRNMQVGQFEMAYSILLPCIFSVYLHPEDHARLASIFSLLAEDARRALCDRVTKLNTAPTIRGVWRSGKPKEHKIACRDWVIEFFPDTEGAVPLGDVEIHSELNETGQPGYRGTKTTLMDREPTVANPRTRARHVGDSILAEIRYEDDSGSQLYLVTQNQVRVGRGGDDEPADLALYASDEVSRDHFLLRRDAATGQFFVTDKSTNGTWLDGKRLKRGAEQPLPERAELGVAGVLTLNFQVRK
jgi:FHA domain